MKFDFKSLLPHALAISIFIILLCIYFQPVTEGYKLRQGDNIQYKGMSAEINAFREKYGDEPLWTNGPFGGMPAGLISVQYKNNWMNHVERAMELWLPAPINIFFVCMLGFYILFLCLRVDPWLGIIGAIAFGFSTYTFLIIEAGHNTKALAIAWMPALLGAVIYTYRRKPLWGMALVMFFTGLELRANHLQVTYYLFMILLFYGIFEMIRFISKGEAKKFFIRSAFILGGLIIGALPNYSMLKGISDIAGETTRAESKLTIKADGSSNKEDKTGGLDRSYIVDYSYGKLESFNMFIPNLMGGASGLLGNNEGLLDDVENPQVKQQVMQMNQYWGDQGMAAPFYLGAVIITLFILSFVFISDITKWGFLGITVLALMLMWGKNMPGLTNFFIDNVPGYNKFRAVTILIAVLQVTVPLLGVWGLSYLIKKREEFKKNIMPVAIAGGAILVVVLFLLMMGSSSMDFLSDEEKKMFGQSAMAQGNNPQQAAFVNEVKKELVDARASLFTADAVRTLGLVAATLLLIFMFIYNVFNKYVLYGLTGLLVLIDMWSVDLRFLNNDETPDGQGYVSWVKPEEQEMPHYANDADYVIFESEARKQPQLLQSIQLLENNLKKQKVENEEENTSLTLAESDLIRFRELNFATNYRVLNIQNPFNDGRTSYFHKSIGGYHGAKQKRIQEIIEFHYQKEMQAMIAGLNAGKPDELQNAFRKTPVLNMMNMRYVLINTQGKGSIYISPDTVIPPMEKPSIVVNGFAQGNGWFVKGIKVAPSDDSEIVAIGKIDLTELAVMRENMKTKINAKGGTGEGTIEMESYKPNKLVYNIESKGENTAVFSEIYTEKGWTAKLDGKEIPIARANYILRAVTIPDGKHKLEFIYDLPSYRNGEKISLAGSVLLLGFFLFALYKTLTGQKEETEEETVVTTPVSKTNVID